ncbi:hypothetical protein [Lacisediminihabitans sp.]|uniref:hypothetical protein n=1 Tax=Lacisediminihabitans sp. TaxID=2787631 RepID=UPI00374D8726
MHRKFVVAFAACVVAVSLSACAGSPGPGSSSSSNPPPSTTSTPSRTPTPTPAPINTADPATWIVSETGIGPFQLGANLKMVTADLPGLTADNANCPNPQAAFLTGTGVAVALFVDSVGNIVGVNAGPTHPAGNPLAGPHTALGIGYSSTAAELTTAYPAIERTDYLPDAGFPLYTVKTATGRWISFDVDLATQTVNGIGVWPGTRPPYEYCG